MLSFMAFSEDAGARDKGLGEIHLQAAPAVGSYVSIMDNDGGAVSYVVTAIILSASRGAHPRAGGAGDLVLRQYPEADVVRHLLFGPRDAESGLT